jgi:uracil-DNA glycosylase
MVGEQPGDREDVAGEPFVREFVNDLRPVAECLAAP